MEHSPRHDDPRVDPTGIKSKLAEYANATFATMLHNFGTGNKITLGKHNLDCQADMINTWYTDDNTGRHDGIHFLGSRGTKAYTWSVLEIIQNILPSNSFTDHSSCPQAKYAKSQKQKQLKTLSHIYRRNIYTVPMQNRFDILGN